MNWSLNRRALALAAALLALAPAGARAATLTGVDLSRYVRVGRYDLPEPTRTPAPPGSLLAQEASSVTYDWDTGTLFVVGDGGTSVVQVDKTGRLIDSMTLAPGSSPQGTEFYDTEGIAYVGGGQFVITEERYRQLARFTYVAEHDADPRAGADGQARDDDRQHRPRGRHQRPARPAASSWSRRPSPRGSSRPSSTSPPARPPTARPRPTSRSTSSTRRSAGLNDFSDVFALANVRTLSGPDARHLLIISQESGKVVNIDRTGHVSSALVIRSDPGNPLSVAEQTDEGVTLDDDGNLYVANEEGGGDVNHPQLWVYAPSTAPDQAPTAVTLTHPVASLPDTTSTAAPVKVADVDVTDDGIGVNDLSVTGPDAGAFSVDDSGLYLKAGTALDHLAKPSYTVSVAVDDPSAGSTPDAVSAPFTLTITAGGAPPTLAVTEVSPWSSGDAPYKADWWELTNTGPRTVDLTGFKMDDNSNAFANAVALNGVPALAPGQSAVFIEGNASTANAFKAAWFGAGAPAGFAIGSYSGSGVGLSTDGDAVNIFDPQGDRVTGVSFGSATTGFTFDNAALRAAPRSRRSASPGATGRSWRPTARRRARRARSTRR